MVSLRQGSAGNRGGPEDEDVRSPALFWGLILGIVGLRAIFTFEHLTGILFLPGPNSLGEADMVFFAGRLMDGQWPFASGLEPPYLPSIHGFILHGLAGIVGVLGGLTVTDLYYAGRAISVMATLAAFVLFWRLGQRISAFPPLLALCLLLWAGSPTILQHSTSFRPDNWLLALSLLACWLVAVRSRSAVTLTPLIVLPVVAFHVKVTGIAIAAAVVAGLFYRDGIRTAVGVAVAQAILMIASVASLQWFSGGIYLAGLGAAGSGNFSPAFIISSLWTAADPLVVFLVVGPAVVGVAAGRRLLSENRVTAVTAIFWAVTFGTYVLAASRAGSNVYYFLEPAAFGSLVLLAGLERLRRRAMLRKPSRWWLHPLTAGVLLLLVPALVNLHAWQAQGRYMTGVWNHSIARTEQMGEVRLQLADKINRDGLSCFTDDPGLNVLLREPQVIDLYLQSHMMKSGALPKNLRWSQVHRRAWDCVVISGRSWSYHGMAALPDSFFTAVRKRYPRLEMVGGYEVRLRP